jgi:hypothetical protein
MRLLIQKVVIPEMVIPDVTLSNGIVDEKIANPLMAIL